MRQTIPLALLAALFGALPGTRADAEGRPVVVELFTSQSCSSCPPAEALLGQIAGEGGAVLPLAFHVTYWDHLDWRDTYALPAATARQAAYARRLGGGSYTPEAVIDGRVGLVGSDAGAVRGAIAKAEGAASAQAPVTLTRRGGTLVVAIGAGQGAGQGARQGAEQSAGTVTLVGFDPSHATRVARGENAGRTIIQANIVRAVSDLGRWSGQAATWETPLPAGADAAVIVQGADGRIFGAARLGPAT